MFRLPRRSAILICGLVATLLTPATGAAAATAVPFLSDSIAPGVLEGTDGFGTATVLVPKGGYVTYLVRTDSRYKGKKIQIWTDTGTGWAQSTSRVIAADGSIHYHARINGRTGFWAKFVDGKTSATSHARSATVSTDGTTIIRLSCDDVGPTGSGVKSIVGRMLALRVTGTVRVIVCANPSTGFSWGLVSVDSNHLIRVGHTLQGSSGPPGSPGSETWSLRLTEAGTGRATLMYSQPWRGGEKAVWTLMLTIQST